MTNQIESRRRVRKRRPSRSFKFLVGSALGTLVVVSIAWTFTVRNQYLELTNEISEIRNAQKIADEVENYEVLNIEAMIAESRNTPWLVHVFDPVSSRGSLQFDEAINKFTMRHAAFNLTTHLLYDDVGSNAPQHYRLTRRVNPQIGKVRVLLRIKPDLPPARKIAWPLPASCDVVAKISDETLFNERLTISSASDLSLVGNARVLSANSLLDVTVKCSRKPEELIRALLFTLHIVEEKNLSPASAGLPREIPATNSAENDESSWIL